jgi:hypothetical protein
MRFHPKRRASIDHAPGPSIAKAAPRVPSRMQIHGSPGCKRIFHISIAATIVPATGVHKPASKSAPAPVSNTHRMITCIGWASHSLVTPRSINAIPTTRRIRRRPTPGHPRAKVENNRRKGSLVYRLGKSRCGGKPKESRAVTLSSDLGFNNAAPYADHGSVGAVVGAQFGEDVLDSALDGFFGDRELIGNLFIGISGGD